MEKLISKPSTLDDAKKPDDRMREVLRKRLLEMIRRNEESRRTKAR